MIILEEITTTPTFSSQLENKMLYSNHTNDVSVSYRSTYTLKYVIEGVKHYNYNNQDIKVSKNQYVILNNDCKITTEAKKGTKGLSFFLSPKLINEIYHYYSNHNSSIEFFEVPQSKANSRTDFLLAKISYLYEHNPIAFNQQMENLFIRVSELIVQEQTNIDTKFLKLNIIKRTTQKELYKLITKTRDYLNDNFKENLSLDMISRDIGISKYYLHRLFTEVNGVTPLGYLTRIRIEHAKAKLQHSTDTISEIAIVCGFDNISYFSNTFKNIIGLSPTQYRKKL